MKYKNCDIQDLLLETLVKIEGLEQYSDKVYFTTESGKRFKMHHRQDCCEQVAIEEVIGEVEDLLNEPITMAEEVSESANGVSESGTWTFYKLATRKGYVTIRWLGTSNGYYSESVDFSELSA